MDIKLFESKRIRSEWSETDQKWYFSIVDVVGTLTESVDPLAYWRKLKERLKKEGNETVTNCHGLKMVAADGKMRMTDVADTAAEISKATFGIIPSDHKKIKGLSKSAENLRDHMTDLELIFTMLGEASTTEIAKNKDAQGFEENKKAAKQGGAIAGNARKELEQKSGKKVVNPDNYLGLEDKKKLK